MFQEALGMMLQTVLVAVVPVLAVLFGKLVNAQCKRLEEQTKEEKAVHVLSASAVNFLNMVYGDTAAFLEVKIEEKVRAQN